MRRYLNFSSRGRAIEFIEYINSLGFEWTVIKIHRPTCWRSSYKLEFEAREREYDKIMAEY